MGGGDPGRQFRLCRELRLQHRIGDRHGDEYRDATIPVGNFPVGVGVTPDGSILYVTNSFANTVSAIATATNTVTATIPVGRFPVAFGIFIQPAPSFAGTPGFSNCLGQSVAALAQQFGGLNAAAAASGFSSVRALQNAILTFCGG
jgi:YVTN family beta-propeller protein